MINKCIHCGGEGGKEYDEFSDAKRIKCVRCKAVGPWKGWIEHAIEEWNAGVSVTPLKTANPCNCVNGECVACVLGRALLRSERMCQALKDELRAILITEDLYENAMKRIRLAEMEKEEPYV